MQKTYESKRDGWLVVVIWAAVVGMLAAVAGIWKAPLPSVFQLAVPLFVLTMAGFMLWVLYGTNYTLTFRELIIRSGPFRWTIQLDSITEVFPTHNPLSSPACSLDRLYIRYQGSRFGVMISPQDKSEFLRDLAARVPGLKLEKERMLRA